LNRYRSHITICVVYYWGLRYAKLIARDCGRIAREAGYPVDTVEYLRVCRWLLTVLLVVVPSDALRTQIADKFLTLGVLKDFGVISQGARYPVVGILKHKPRNAAEADTFFQRCNVIVTTAHIAGQCNEEVQVRMAEHCPYLFIDEAHHNAAATWYGFKQKFEAGKILQFTVTPFRNDGKLVVGKIIFNYPLRKALEEEYFKTINFKPIIAYDRHEADEAIAEKAVEQLREDRQQYDHILMARVLHGDVTLSEEPPGDEAADVYLYNPMRPVPTVGGQVILPGGNATWPGDQRCRDAR
jgi:superfamily II DNA or RNA helicase